MTREEFERAMILARVAHAGQKDKTGAPYIDHIQRVVDKCSGWDTKTVAALHNIAEDCDITFFDLIKLGFNLDVVNAVELLTKFNCYEEYIDRIYTSENILATKVKIADLEDHLENPGCPQGNRPKYEAALRLLTGQV